MKSILKNSAKFLAIVAIVSNTVACTDEQVAQNLGAAAIIAGAIAIAATTPPPVCVGGYRNVCHDYVNYYGVVQTECQSVYDSCINQYVQEDIALDVAGAAASTQSPGAASPDLSLVNAVNWGQAFNVGFEGSDKLVSALMQAKAGKLQPVLDLGLSKDDVKRLAQFKLPAAQGIDALSKSLNTDAATTSQMLTKILSIAKEQKAAQDAASQADQDQQN